MKNFQNISIHYLDIYSNGSFFLPEGSSILFMYQAGNKPTHVQGKSSSSLSDNNWHSVYIERNKFVVILI